MSRPTVLVVGAGPVGLATALTLVAYGITPRIIDRARTIPQESRAIGILPDTLERLAPMGLADPLIEAGCRIHGLRVTSNGETRAEVDAARSGRLYEFLLTLPQNRTVEILSSILGTRGTRVERGVEVTHVETDPEGTTATLSTGETLRTDWLVGADGAHSTVRKALGIAFPGDAYPGQWSLADMELEAPEDRGQIVLDTGRPLLARIPLGGGVHRLISNHPEACAHAADIWNAGRTLWESDYTVSHRLAASFGWDRARIVGDAAHIHSPAGGRGMNLGIADGVSLAARIAEGHLGYWDVQRRTVARRVIRQSDAMQTAATKASAPVRSLMPRLLGAATRVPMIHEAIARRVIGVHLG